MSIAAGHRRSCGHSTPSTGHAARSSEALIRLRKTGLHRSTTDNDFRLAALTAVAKENMPLSAHRSRALLATCIALPPPAAPAACLDDAAVAKLVAGYPTTPVDRVFEFGFDPLLGEFRAQSIEGNEFEIIDQWIEVVPTDQVAAVSVKYDPITGRPVSPV